MMSSFQGCSLTRSAFLLFLFFLSLSFKPAETEVVKSISDCAEFLLNQSPPEIPKILKDKKILDQNRYKPICQTYQNTRTFLTLYDTKERIPVFSAIKFVQEKEPGGRNQKWMIEPQLENISEDKNMKTDDKNQGTYNYQASNFDYTDIFPLNRGHICPRSYASTEKAKNSTFTLTNVVPQENTFNGGSWERMENCIKCIMEKFCKNNNGAIEGFVVAGAEPSQSSKLKDHVNIPSKMWSAFCCYSKDKNVWLASAHWGENVPEPKGTYMQTKTLNELHQLLGTQGEDFNVFPGTKCPLEKTVTEFYPDLHKSCSCSPPTFKQKNKNQNKKNKDKTKKINKSKNQKNKKNNDKTKINKSKNQKNKEKSKKMNKNKKGRPSY